MLSILSATNGEVAGSAFGLARKDESEFADGHDGSCGDGAEAEIIPLR